MTSNRAGKHLPLGVEDRHPAQGHLAPGAPPAPTRLVLDQVPLTGHAPGHHQVPFLQRQRLGNHQQLLHRALLEPVVLVEDAAVVSHQGRLHRHRRHGACLDQDPPGRGADAFQGPGPLRRSATPLDPHPGRREVDHAPGVPQVIPRADLAEVVDRDGRGLLGADPPLVKGRRSRPPDRRDRHEQRQGQGERHAESPSSHVRPP